MYFGSHFRYILAFHRRQTKTKTYKRTLTLTQSTHTLPPPDIHITRKREGYRLCVNENKRDSRLFSFTQVVLRLGREAAGDRERESLSWKERLERRERRRVGRERPAGRRERIVPRNAKMMHFMPSLMILEPKPHSTTKKKNSTTVNSSQKVSLTYVCML